MLEDRNGRKEPGPFLSPQSTTSSLSWSVQLSLIVWFSFRGRIDFTMPAASSRLISVHPDELKFQLELGKQSYCDLKVWNNTEHHVAFKVKTTSPKKYFVQPNIGVIHPWDSSVIRVTLQSQSENPRDMQCKDKFLLQSTIVPPNTEVDGLQQDTFNKDDGKAVEECKLRVVYVSPQAAEEALKELKQNIDSSSDLQRLKDEKDKIIQQTQLLQQELETLKRRRNRKGESGFSQIFAVFVGLIGIMVGILLNLSLSSPSTE
ncbi:vesicle-associated protein 2-1-like [Diospyros lotus]|uniref:vesicle-associated protein 2-1-like n=1 Tax=Diospyros lotus TaxID=55363 RepID=UPI002254190F|nr:vesicle-associated protein 2-1-like [Diospyros lotus]